MQQLLRYINKTKQNKQTHTKHKTNEAKTKKTNKLCSQVKANKKQNKKRKQIMIEEKYGNIYQMKQKKYKGTFFILAKTEWVCVHEW